jgi:hypothetical protein
MGYANSRRCPLWVSPRAFVVTEELAHSIGLDVDTFIESTVLALREREALDGPPGARNGRSKKATSYQWPIAEGGYVGQDE